MAIDRMETDKSGNGSPSTLHYYLQDELGSPLRVSGYDTDLHSGTGTNTPYLTYGYDEFGNDLYDDLYNDLEETGIPNPYSRQGEDQPFGYTGYRHDGIGGTYFAQAREYQPQNGRLAEDVLKGNGAFPETLNRYGYCWNMPISYVDWDGKIGYYFYDPDMFCENNINMDALVEMDLASLAEQYQTEIVPIAMDVDDPNNNYTTFENAWNAIAEKGEKVDVMVIMAHANNGWFVPESSVSVNDITGEVERGSEEKIYRSDIQGLKDIEIGTLYLFGCNMGLTDYEPEYGKNSLASMFYAKESRKSIDMIIAADGSIRHGRSEGKRVLYAIPSDTYHSDGNFDGFKRYKMVNGELQTTPIEDISVYWGEISSVGYGGDEEGCIGEKKIDEKKKKK